MRCFTVMNKDQRKKKSLEPKKKRSRSSRASERTSNTPTDESGKRKSTGDDDELSDELSEDHEEIEVATTSDKITSSQLKLAKSRRNSRLCGSLDCLMNHINNIKKIKCAKTCEVCGVDVYTVYMLCLGRPGIHFFPTKGIAKGKQCFLDFHSDKFYGLARIDATLFDGKPQRTGNHLEREQSKGMPNTLRI